MKNLVKEIDKLTEQEIKDLRKVKMKAIKDKKIIRK
jgi:hypothetical protein